MPKKLVFSAGTLFLFLGTIAPAYAQHEHEERAQGKPPQAQQHQPERPAQQSHPQPHQPSRPVPRPQQSFGGAYHGGVEPNGPTHGGVHHSGVPQHAGQVRDGFMQSRAKAWNNEHHTWRERGGYNGYRVPEDRFRLYFGRDHFFRVGRLPLVFVGGYPRFQYDGYWVTFVDPWPEAWAPTWYDTDDAILTTPTMGTTCTTAYPGTRIAITLSF